jgi:drug/metabolite transporter (DMT)-like permease
MTRRAWLLMALLAALWGASYLFIKVALDDGIEPVFIVFARIALGAAVLVPLARRGAGLGPVRGLRGPICLLALVQVVLPFLLITFGERHIASSLAGILVSAAPIFTALIAARFDDDERPHGIATAGVAMGIVGVVLLFGVDLSGDAQALAGGLMVLLAAAGYAVGSLYLKHRLRGVAPVGIAASTMLAGALMLLPFALFTLPGQAPELQTAGAMLALGAGGTGIAFAIYFTLIAEIGPGRASLVAYIAPGFAVVYGVTLLSEPLTLGALVGLVLILAGSWVAAEGRWPGRRRPRPVPPPEPVPAPPPPEPARP